jgi:hypothetical protein
MIDDTIESISLKELQTRLLTAYGVMDNKFSADVRKALQFAIVMTIIMINEAPGLTQMLASHLAAQLMLLRAEKGDA